jgi:filamentous hemagglutinin family protein
MNRIYRLVWSQVNRAWVAVAENAKGHGKSISANKLVAAAAALIGGSLLASSVYAADAGNATVVGGAGSVSQSGATTTINQSSQRLAIDWTNLSTAANEALVFKQPNASAIALNRITGSSPSTLLGSLTANGQVYILNPNGVLFGAGAQVNVGGLVASTLTMNPADFMNGSSTFTKDPNAAGTVDNQGTLTAANGGYIALLSGTVRNEGTIDAPLGTALLAAGDKVTLNVNNGSLIGYSIDQGDLNALIENKQLIRADGGQVLMVAKALDKLSTAVINNTGIVEARTVQNKNGHILLLGDMDVGTVNVGGTLDASAPTGGDGGAIETSAAHVEVADGTVVTTAAVPGLGLTGSWLIDPTDFTVAASGGDMTGATLDSNLGTTNFEVKSTDGAVAGNGDININDVVSWNAATTLTLSAQRNININQSITAANAAGKVSLKYGLGAVNAGNTATYNVNAPINLQAGNNFSTQLGSDGALIQYQVITSLGSAGSATGTDLQGMSGNVSGNYVLGSNIDATATAGWNSGAGFVPVGTDPFDSPFNGLFDGLGHVINNLMINRPATDYVGLFGFAEGGTIRNVGVVGGSITGNDNVGGLVGVNQDTVNNSYTTASVSGASYVGGLIGLGTGTISNSYATGVVRGIGTYASAIGGLVGYGGGDISNSFATGNVSGLSVIGGLVGVNGDNGSISNSFATGIVSGLSKTGGLVGVNTGYGSVNISNSFASGNVSGSNYAGGLVGFNTRTISNSYASGDVSGSIDVGGLAGFNSGTISDSFAANQVTGTSMVGGLVGVNSNGTEVAGITALGTITASFWNTTSSGIGVGIGSGRNGGVTGIDNADASKLSTFANAGWNIDATGGTDTIWRIYDGQSGPLLRSFLTQITVTGGAVSKTYDGTTTTAGGAYTTSINGAVLDGSMDYVTSKNVGAYSTADGTLTATGLYSGQQGGYDIIYVGASETIGQANITLTAPPVVKNYNGTTEASGPATVTAGTIFTGDSLVGSIAYTDKNAGAGDKTVTASGVTVDDGNGGNNYNITYVDNTHGTINKADVTLSTSNVVKTYDGTTVASGTGVAVASSIYAGDSLSGGSFLFTDKNAGSGDKTVTVSGITINDGNGGNNYNVTYVNNTTSTINKANVTLSTSDVVKTYDGTTVASGTSVASVGSIFAGDNLIGGSFAFTDKNAGSGDKTVTVSGITINDGNGGNNYNVSYADNTTSTINQAELELTAGSVSKTYDGGISVASDTVSVTGGQIFSGDSITGNGTFTFADKNVGNNKTVTDSGATVGDGTNNGNYHITYVDNTASIITQAELELTAGSVSKTYDGGISVASDTVSVTGGQIFGGDSITDNGTFTFADKNVGNNKTVTVSGATVGDGTNNGNYHITYVDNTASAISQAELELTAGSVSKTYDGGTSVASDTVSVTGGQIFSGDSITDNGTFTFADKNAGDNKTVTVSGATVGDGTNNGNYHITYVDNTASAISQAELELTAGSVSKTYDGGISVASDTVSVTGGQLFSGDSITGNGTFTFDDKNVGNNKTVTVSGATVGDGTNNGNYHITYVDNTASTISQANVTLSTSDVVKTYDGTTAASGSAIVTSGTIFTGDSFSGGSFAFTDKNAGAGDKTVTAGGVTIDDGNGGNNYNITYVDNTHGTINKADVTLSTSDVVKTYDGTTAASGSAVVTSGTIFTGDSINGGSFAFTDKNAGNGDKTVTTSGITIDDGNGGNNYNVSYADNTTSTINKADLIVTETGVDKVYDGSIIATVTYGDNRIAGDDLNFTSTASFADKNVGNGKTVTVSGIALNGADAGNYNLIASGSTMADITPASLTITAEADAKSYDGRPFAGGNGVTIDGLVNGETVADLLGTLGYGGSSQGATAIGNYMITPGGLNSANYRISFVDGLLSIKAISQASAALGGTTLEQPYDATEQTISSMTDDEGQGSPSRKKDNAFDMPGVAADGNRSASPVVAQVTPRLRLAGCGVSMPAGAGSSCQ